MISARPTLVLLAALTLGGACAHTREAEDPAPSEKREQAEGGGEAGSNAGSKKAAQAKASGKEQDSAQRRASHHNPTPAPLSPSAGGLLKPGAEEKIQDQLAKRGLLDRDDARAGALDGATRDAVRRFQREANLPETGIPDRETARRLGLTPDDIFEKNDSDD